MLHGLSQGRDPVICAEDALNCVAMLRVPARVSGPHMCAVTYPVSICSAKRSPAHQVCLHFARPRLRAAHLGLRALDGEQAAAAAARKGEEQPEGVEVFDSNCITPGTAFMARLGAHLRFFIRHKMKDDPVWQTPRIIFSGTPAGARGRPRPCVPLPPPPSLPPLPAVLTSLDSAWERGVHDMIYSESERTSRCSCNQRNASGLALLEPRCGRQWASAFSIPRTHASSSLPLSRLRRDSLIQPDRESVISKCVVVWTSVTEAK